MWDPINGFGISTSVSNYCVQGGPLHSISLNYTANGYDRHCLTRHLEDSPKYGEMHGLRYTQEIIESLISNATTYHEFRTRLEIGPHKHVHDGTGGEMPGPSSPNGMFFFFSFSFSIRKTLTNSYKWLIDPIFFLHHAQVDRLWDQWQQRQPQTRTQEFVGKDNLGYDVDLSSELDVMGLDEREVRISDVMTTLGGSLCYRYSVTDRQFR